MTQRRRRVVGVARDRRVGGGGTGRTKVAAPPGVILAKPLWVVESGAGAVPWTRKPKKTLPCRSAVSGVFTNTVDVNPFTLAWNASRP